MKMAKARRLYDTIRVTAEVDVCDVIGDLDDDVLIEELKSRGKSGEVLVGAIHIERDLIAEAYREASAGRAASAAALLDRLLHPAIPADQGANRLMQLRIPGAVQ